MQILFKNQCNFCTIIIKNPYKLPKIREQIIFIIPLLIITHLILYGFDSFHQSVMLTTSPPPPPINYPSKHSVLVGLNTSVEV